MNREQANKEIERIKREAQEKFTSENIADETNRPRLRDLHHAAQNDPIVAQWMQAWMNGLVSFEVMAYGCICGLVDHNRELRVTLAKELCKNDPNKFTITITEP